MGIEKTQFIAEVKVGDMVESTFIVAQKQVKKKSGISIDMKGGVDKKFIIYQRRRELRLTFLLVMRWLIVQFQAYL